MRLCGLFLFMTLALVGIGISGVPPTLSRDRKLFPDTTCTQEAKEENAETDKKEELKF